MRTAAAGAMMAAGIGVLAAALLAATVAAASTLALPASAEEAISLADGAWALQQKGALRVIDADGHELARVAVRGKHLDARTTAGGTVVVTVDADTQSVVLLRLGSRTATPAAPQVLAPPPFGIEGLCLYRDRQELDRLIVIGKDGQAEEWLLPGASAATPARERRLYRRLALPPNSLGCRVDDASGTLYVGEEGLGVWAYQIGGEGIPSRTLVALAGPGQALPHDPGALLALPGGVAVLDLDGSALRLFERHDRGWQAGPVLAPAIPTTAGTPAAPNAAGAANAADQLARIDEPDVRSIALRNTADGSWQLRALPASTALTRPAAPRELPIVLPRAQTEPVARLGDAADDPAIWIHPVDASKSRVLGTNKKQGLLVYDLAGRQLQLLESGRLNNVDLRQQVRLGGETFDVAVATQRDDLSLVLFTIDADGQVAERARIPTGLPDIYGLCLYQPPRGGLEVFVNDKDGRFVQYRIARHGGKFRGSVVRRFAVASQPEGCVADDRAERLFIGEEDRGLWVTSARADRPAILQMILPVGELLVADTEGVALRHGALHSYLVVSSQGNSSYVVLDAAPPYRARGAFRVGIDPVGGIDGTSDTDGLDVTATAPGPSYPQGLLVVQDGYKRLPDGPQNFKYVSWEDVARALSLP
jgi:3-phytase